jgi:hypothetical protein
LFRNCAQKLGALGEEVEKIAEVHEIKNLFCWEIRAPRMSFLGVWEIFGVEFINN